MTMGSIGFIFYHSYEVHTLNTLFVHSNDVRGVCSGIYFVLR
jgi:hypothetical protein